MTSEATYRRVVLNCGQSHELPLKQAVIRYGGNRLVNGAISCVLPGDCPECKDGPRRVTSYSMKRSDAVTEFALQAFVSIAGACGYPLQRNTLRVMASERSEKSLCLSFVNVQIAFLDPHARERIAGICFTSSKEVSGWRHSAEIAFSTPGVNQRLGRFLEGAGMGEIRYMSRDQSNLQSGFNASIARQQPNTQLFVYPATAGQFHELIQLLLSHNDLTEESLTYLGLFLKRLRALMQSEIKA